MHQFTYLDKREVLQQEYPSLQYSLSSLPVGSKSNFNPGTCRLYVEILEVDVYPNSTTILLDKLKLKIYLNSNNYSSMDQHVSTG